MPPRRRPSATTPAQTASTSSSRRTSRKQAETKERPFVPVIPRTNDLVARSLGATALPGKQGGSLRGGEVRKLRESASFELRPQTLGRNVDRRVGADREGEESLPTGSEDAGQLVEEGDHVRVGDEVKAGGRIGKRRCVSGLEANPPCQLRGSLPPSLIQHPVGHVGADHVGLRESSGDREGSLARARAEIECTPRGRLDRGERRLVREKAH